MVIYLFKYPRITLLILVCVFTGLSQLSGYNNHVLQQLYSEKALADSGNVIIKDLLAYRATLRRINLLPTMKFGISWNTIQDSELYDYGDTVFTLGNDIYNRYYARDLIILDVASKGKLTMNLKDAQTSKGFLKFSIPLSNFPTGLRNNSTEKNSEK